jgi:hypothetical protein
MLSPTAIGIVVLACTFGGALAGMKLRGVFLVLEMDSPFRA